MKCEVILERALGEGVDRDRWAKAGEPSLQRGQGQLAENRRASKRVPRDFLGRWSTGPYVPTLRRWSETVTAGNKPWGTLAKLLG